MSRVAQVLTAKVRVEQRASRRRRAAVRCWVADEGISHYVRLIDVSTAGARIEMSMPPTVGERVSVRFRLRANDEEVFAAGTVVWRNAGFRGRGGVIGVHFTHVEDAPTILAYVERMQ